MTADWWGISAKVVAWSGVVVILLAMLAPWIKQRVRRRRRCPKCWYDLSHSPAPATTCSECGYTAKRERKLYKARRRWRFAFLGVFMLFGAYALNVTPAVKDRGWVAALPTTAVICMLPIAGQDRSWNDDLQRWVENPFSEEMGIRLENGSLYNWQIRWAIERCRVVRTREAWPADIPLHIGLFLPSWLPSGLHATPKIPGGERLWYRTSTSGTFAAYHRAHREYMHAGHLPAGAKSIDVLVEVAGGIGGPFAFRPRVEWTGIVRLPVRSVESVHASIYPVSNPDLDRTVLTSLEASLRRTEHGVHFSLHVDRSRVGVPDDVAIGIAAELRRDGELMYAIPCEDRITTFTNQTRYTAWLHGFDLEAAMLELERWSLHVRADVNDALREFHRPNYWLGEVSMPLLDVVK